VAARTHRDIQPGIPPICKIEVIEMKKIKLFIMKSCPYCKMALSWMDTLFAENSDYRRLDIEIIDELAEPVIAARHDYYYVPTYYVGDKKMHEGAASLKKIKHVFDAAMEP